MAPNELQIGKTRFGYMYDGNDATPQIRVQLHRRDAGHVELIIPWSRGGGEEFYRRWFAGDAVQFSDDPERTKYRYSVPSVLSFEDIDGHVALVGCSALGYTDTLGWGGGVGRARVRYAVIGGRSLEYGRINGMRTRVSGLQAWLGIRSVSTKWVDDGAVISTHAAPPREVSGIEGLSIIPTVWVQEGGEGETIVRESVMVQTLTENAERWDSHWETHGAVRDLVAIASWRNEEFAEVRVCRADDPLRVASGDPVGTAWHEVIGPQLKPESSATLKRHMHEFMFKPADLSADPIAAWIGLREEFSRAVKPMVSSLNVSGAVELRLAQAGIGMEALGYVLALKTRSASAANGLNFRQRLEVIVSEVPIELPFDVSEWVEGAAAAYNGIKHANRDLPDPIEILNRTRECQLVFRSWVAHRLGMAPELLQQAVDRDPMVHEYVALTDPADELPGAPIASQE
ncbi:HEPN domain-containing protein [Cellulomonas cellasea]|uniref:ApeA N-terminal domain-containing protein n=1 Tax=Cellulomonas cellasea TaxID=43670 RepID=A0A7W4UBS6_9CELL|nr:HEPN domain-containing protein [Cellulomonas cellasea]MBB2921315.1 hypothetical protein [Cellulomonas cellasea]